MEYPLVICASNTLKIGASDFFEDIGAIDLGAGTLELNVTSSGTTGLKWILDAQGDFYELAFIELLPLTLLQHVGLSRRREKFRIIPGRKISARELAERVSGLHNQFEEAPNVTDMKEFLASLAPDQLLGREEMFQYLGV